MSATPPRGTRFPKKISSTAQKKSPKKKRKTEVNKRIFPTLSRGKLEGTFLYKKNKDKNAINEKKIVKRLLRRLLPLKTPVKIKVI